MLTQEQREEMIEAIGEKHGEHVSNALHALYESITWLLEENERLKERIKELERDLSEAI